MTEGTAKVRLDKWLWQTRFFKSRSLSAGAITGGHVRLNSDKVHKPATSVAPGDVLTFAQGRRIRVIKVLGLPTRRGPAPEAEGFYEDLSPPEDAVPKNPGFEGKGRPTGKDRRAIRSFRRSPLE